MNTAWRRTIYQVDGAIVVIPIAAKHIIIPNQDKANLTDTKVIPNKNKIIARTEAVGESINPYWPVIEKYFVKVDVVPFVLVAVISTFIRLLFKSKVVQLKIIWARLAFSSVV